MSEKRDTDYKKLLKHLDTPPEQFLMVGNSLKSDILPVLNIGGYGVHVPYHTTWAYEHMEDVKIENERFYYLQDLSQLPGILS